MNRHSPATRAIRSLLVCAACLAAGCGRKGDRPATFPVAGTVSLDGTPLAGARVSFEAHGVKYWAEGLTDASGRYALMTFEPGDGAVPGVYQVVITKYEDPATVPESRRERPDYVPRNLLPARYATSSTSGLSATVTAESGSEANRFDFTLLSRHR